MTVRLILVSLCITASTAFAQAKKKEEKKDAPPRVLLCNAVAVALGKPAKLTLRGTKLEIATEVRLTPALGPVKIVEKKTSAPPQNTPVEKYGDTELRIEFTVPKEAAVGVVEIVVVNPAGESTPLKLLVGCDAPIIAEKEPNNGFAQPQAIAVPQAVDEAIGGALDVDVYRFEGKAGDLIEAEVFAARHGSWLDARLTLYDADGREIAVSDDTKDSADPRLAVKLPKDGAYMLVVADAHDMGGGFHGYRLTVRRGK